jgi:hypothetical protein
LNRGQNILQKHHINQHFIDVHKIGKDEKMAQERFLPVVALV